MREMIEETIEEMIEEMIEMVGRESRDTEWGARGERSMGMWEPNRTQGQTPRPDRQTGQDARQPGQPGWAHLPDARESTGDAQGQDDREALLPEFSEMPVAGAYTADAESGAGEDGEADAAAMAGLGGSAALDAFTQRAQMRQLIREFLRAVPRDETDAVLCLQRPNGATRLLTRAQLSAAIDRLRPRQRQIVRLTLEERWPRARVCAYLKNISIKTLERDQVEALDILAEL